jgi:hypothetical protein
MGSIDRRLYALERLIHPPEETGDAHRRQLVSEFTRRVLDAMASIRRSPIDPEQYRYSVEKLRQESPATVAAYVCALAHLEHEDEAEAREILGGRTGDENMGLATVAKLVDTFANGRNRCPDAG